MPVTAAKSSPELAIHLEGHQKQYAPGDVLVGSVSRTLATVSPTAHLTVSLHGRSQSGTVTSTGMTQTQVVGRFTFFDERTTRQTLLAKQPIHIAAAEDPQAIDTGGSWPFCIDIPSRIHHQSLATPEIKPKHSLLSLEADEVNAQPLPPTFFLEGRSPANLVEYYLKAELTLPRSGKTKVYEAILPISVITPHGGPPITDFKLQSQSRLVAVSSPRLLPGMENAPLSFTHRLQKRVRSSGLPRLSFRVEVDLPTILQLENPNSIPIRVGISRVPGATSPAIQSQDHRLRIESFTVRIKPITELQCRHVRVSPIGSHMEIGMELVAPGALAALGEEVYLYCLAQESPHATPDRPIALDIGQRIGLRLQNQRTRTGGYRLHPGFTTYNIKHSHGIFWELRGTLAGERVVVSAQQGVVVLPPSALGAPAGTKDKTR